MSRKTHAAIRRELLAIMRVAKEWQQTMISAWSSPPSRKWYKDAGAKHVSWHAPENCRAEIPFSEYPENNVDELQKLINYMEAIKTRCDMVIRKAEDRIEELVEQHNEGRIA